MNISDQFAKYYNSLFNFLFHPLYQKMTLILTRSIKQKQEYLLKQPNRLSQLFDKFNCNSLFYIPQNSLVVNTENITFGPSKYSIIFTQNHDLYFKITYYCILYWIFEKKQNKGSSKLYQKLICYIINNNFDPQQQGLPLTEQEFKIYLIKFLYILQTSSSKKKIVFQQLSALPHINSLFLYLIKHISKTDQVIFQKNVRDIEKIIFGEIEFHIDLLSDQLMLFDNEFRVQIRQFEGNSQFSIHHESRQEIFRIREQFFLGQSAYFKNDGKNLDDSQYIFNSQKSIKILKKQTMKSIAISGSEQQQQIDPQKAQQLLEFQKVLFGPISKSKNQILQQTRDFTLCDTINFTSSIQKPKTLNFQEIIDISQGQKLPVATTCSTTFQSDTNRSKISLNNKRKFCHRFNQPSLDFSYGFKNNQLQSVILGVSKSVQQIKNDGYSLDRKSILQRREKRVPSFILNRMKQKELQKNEGVNSRCEIREQKLLKFKIPKITFSYNKVK